MKSYSEKLKDIRWQKKRLQVLERDGWRCRDCGCKDQTLHVHHCHYERGGPWQTPNDLLMSLCEDCHETRQSLESDARKMLASIMAKEVGDDLADFMVSLRRVFNAEYVGTIHTHEEVLDAFEAGVSVAKKNGNNL